MTTHRLEILRHGRWSTGPTSGHVWIVRQNWDYYHEHFYDGGPDLNDEGWAYYAVYGNDAVFHERASRSQTCFSDAEAVQRAESSFDSIAWDFGGEGLP